MGSVEHPHIALLAFPFGTHAAPLLSLAHSLAASAPPGTFFSFVSSRRSVSSLSLSVSPSDNIRFYEVSDGSPVLAPAAASGMLEDPEEEVRLFMKETPGNYRRALEAAVEGCAGTRVTCIIADAFLWFVGEIAAENGVGWVPLWTGGPCSFQAHLYTDLLRDRIGVGEKADLDADLQFIPGLASLRVRDLPEDIVTGHLDGAFATMLYRMATELPRSTSTIILNSFEGLHPEIDADLATKFRKPLPIGPLNLLFPSPAVPEPVSSSRCLAWLDKFEPDTVVYVSFGTVVDLPPSELAELALGLESSGSPFLWSIKDPAKAKLPAGFLDRTRDRGLLVPWIPQVAVLNHNAVAAFLSHCGWNSVLESMTCGVPMVCRPFLGDQMLNSKVVSQVWKVGVRLHNGPMTSTNVAEAIKTVVAGDEGKNMRDRAAKMREKATGSVRPDGSSVRNLNTLLEIVFAR
uniref:Glycosyltransferase n=1 Tax=Iris hollandica TaxID=35876 RepID=Q5KTF3_IRIHO|nr:anthocyanidin 3-O-glucosyltransferase [Iris x hollandica]